MNKIASFIPACSLYLTFCSINWAHKTLPCGTKPEKGCLFFSVQTVLKLLKLSRVLTIYERWQKTDEKNLLKHVSFLLSGIRNNTFVMTTNKPHQVCLCYSYTLKCNHEFNAVLSYSIWFLSILIFSFPLFLLIMTLQVILLLPKPCHSSVERFSSLGPQLSASSSFLSQLSCHIYPLSPPVK